MPLYFTDIAPYCPISRDQKLPNEQGRPLKTRTAIPRATDLGSAILALNITRNIVQSLVFDKTVNNVRDNVQTAKPQKPPQVAKDKYKLTKARWVEQKDKRVKRKYKYYGKLENGKEDKETWVVMERIERMVWYDKGWKSYLVWEYGDKGEGEPTGDREQ